MIAKSEASRRWARRLTVALAVLLLAVGGAARAHDLVPGTAQERPVLLVGGDLYTVSQGVLPATDLLFEDGRITAIGKDLEAPEGAEVVDVSGQRVYPGLIAAQTTLGLVEIGAVRATRDLAEVGPVTPEAAAHVAYNPDSELLPTVRSHGITTVQVVPQGRLLQGRPMLVHLDGWTQEDAALRLTSGVQLAWPAAAPRRGFRAPPPEVQKKRAEEERRLLEQVFADARAYRLAREAGLEEGVDLRWEALGPVLAGEEPLFVEADDVREITEAVAFAREQGVRMVLVGGAEAYKVPDLLAEAGVPVILGTTTALPPRAGDDYALPYKLPRLLWEAGVPFCLSMAGESWQTRNLPFQAGQAVAFGLPVEEALRAVTLSAAEILGIADREGSLEVGKAATLFVSRGDVLDVLGQAVTDLWIDGRRVDLDDRHKELYRKYQEKLRRKLEQGGEVSP